MAGKNYDFNPWLNLFYGGGKLKTVHLPETLVSIGERGFYLCKTLTTVTIPASVNSIADNAFAGTDIAVICPAGSYAAAWCQNHGMLVEAWSPLGCGAVLQDETLGKIAQKYNKSPAQVCVRYALQRGVLPMPKSTHAERIAQNADVFDFTLSDSDMIAIIGITVANTTIVSSGLKETIKRLTTMILMMYIANIIT